MYQQTLPSNHIIYINCSGPAISALLTIATSSFAFEQRASTTVVCNSGGKVSANAHNPVFGAVANTNTGSPSETAASTHDPINCGGEPSAHTAHNGVVCTPYPELQYSTPTAHVNAGGHTLI